MTIDDNDIKTRLERVKTALDASPTRDAQAEATYALTLTVLSLRDEMRRSMRDLASMLRR